ncbi:LytTR family DNA-binding domain-containing protein [Devosia sp. Root436]|uniref:LytTR family DNA-binding domain-containing protein n=1 Tax=Devosia sp. Root436 TaxID=1736537 RepID=UPI001FCD1864|nr:LytTR family DNA-binding domain-containing protein [Devosia sp. Root436]
MNGSLLHSALREMQASLTSPRVLIRMAGASLVLAISGPFDTLSQFDLPGRLLYWLVIVVLSYVSSHAVARLTLDRLAHRLRRPPQRIAVAALAGSIPAWIVVYGVTVIASPGAQVPPLRLWFYCLVVSAVVVTMMVALAPSVPPVTTLPPAPEPPPILARLPHPQRGRLLHLSVSDHYVDVVTDKGRALVLMRLSDAIRETGSVAGLQVHRSHWVALDAVRRTLRQAGKPALELENGTIVPISRSYLDAAKSAGLLV